MANDQRDTCTVIESCGGKQVWPPTKLCKRHAVGGHEWTKKQVLLVCVIETPFGDYFKDLSSIGALQNTRSPFVPVLGYYELSHEALAQLKTHPRAAEIMS